MTGQELLNRVQKNTGVPWQSLRADGYSDGLLMGSPDTEVTGIVTTFTPTLELLKRAVSSGKNAIICREAPFYSRGERFPLNWREGPAPPKELIENDSVYRAKRDFISQNNLMIIRLCDNWDARRIDGQLRGLARALEWESCHIAPQQGDETYGPQNVYFSIPATPLNNLGRQLQEKLRVRPIRVIGDPRAGIHEVALAPGLLLVAQAERILERHSVDAVIAGDAVEWEAVPYFQDLIAAKMAKALILLGEEVSEEPGSGEMASWLKTFLSEVPIEWMPAGEPFWTLGGGARE